MKKNFKLMLATALMMLSGSTAFAQISLGDIFPDGNFVYEVTKAAVANGKAGEVKIVGVREGKNPVSAKKLTLSATCSATVFEDKYSFYVTEFNGNALRTVVTNTGAYVGSFTGQVDAESVEFPKYIKEIPAGALDGYTNMATVTFESGSNLTTVNNFAFATTQITTFDFGNCKKLAGLDDEVFVEAGYTNSYITEVTLPATTLFKSIGGAFKNLTSLTKINGLENSSVTAIVPNAFDNDAKLETLVLPATVKTIADDAFENSGIKNLTIDVTALTNLGWGGEVYGLTVAKLESLTLKGKLGGVIATNAFKGSTNLATLDLSGLSFISGGQIATSAFEGCTKIESVTLGDILDEPGFLGCTIDEDAFKGCTKLATVTVGNINSANAIGEAAFGNALKTVTVGTVKAGKAAILAGAFQWADVSGATLSLAAGEGQYVSSDDAMSNVISATAFDFSKVVNAGASATFVWPTVTIGEIRSKGGVFAAGALKGNNIAKITFGEIAQNGLDKRIIDAGCTVSTLIFNGAIGINGIAPYAFEDLVSKMDITFNGELAEGAIGYAAFNNLLTGSKVSYTKAELTDATVNPFDKNAFSDDPAVDESTPRIIDLVVANEELEAAYKDDAFEGLGTDGVFEIYLVKFYVAPTPPIDPNKFLLYQQGTTTNAWGRFIAWNWTDKNGVVNNKLIPRYQTVEGGAKVKLTLYGTYTDDPGKDNGDPTVYMVPLQSFDGNYEIDYTVAGHIIAKAEIINGGTFANKDVELSYTTTIANNSWWGGLWNTELFINPAIVTNQQLIDRTGMAPDIYAGKTPKPENIAVDLYVMTDPAKYNGFRIDKNPISKEKKTYIGEGWWYMLLRKTTSDAARVVWMDDADATGIFGITEKKVAEGNGAIYTLQGVRVIAPVKGQIYIQNGKKFIAR